MEWRRRRLRRAPDARTRRDPAPVSDDPSVTDLVTRAANGDKHAWDALVERYAPLVWCICRRHRLGDADADDVARASGCSSRPSWTRSAIPPRLLAGWPPRPGGNAAGSCAQRGDRRLSGMCRRASRTSRRGWRSTSCWRPSGTQRSARRSRACLPTPAALIALLIEDPPAPYTQISAQLGIPVGSIGPSRGRCLDKLRRDPAIAALINAEAASAARDLSGAS